MRLRTRCFQRTAVNVQERSLKGAEGWSTERKRRLSGAGSRHEFQGASNVRLELLAMDHRIEHSMFQQKLRALESLRQFLADGLFDHTGAGKSDQSSRLSDIQVTQHGERC